MPKAQKKHGRLDKYYKLAKEKGYRARAAFKLLQLNKKYGFLEKSKVLVDLCAAPGSWCQVASQLMPASSLVIGVDLAPIRSIPRVITFQEDITTDKCRSEIRRHLKTWRADTVLHDGAPNVGTAWVQDAYSQAELVLQSLRLATDFLAEGGTFVTKVFRSKDYNNLLWVFNQLFRKVEATKPPASRNVSAEIYVVCRGYKAPSRIDPKFLDPKAVFEELADPLPNNEAKVFNPEKKKRHREGYEEGNYLLSKSCPVSHYITKNDPIDLLGSMSSFTRNSEEDVKISKMSPTTKEILLCCDDLRVLGKRDFRILLKWRLAVRQLLGFASKKEEGEKEQVSVEPMDEDEAMDKELEGFLAKDASKRKRVKRKDNEKRTKDLTRMQLNMTIPGDPGPEIESFQTEDSMFNLRSIEAQGALQQIAKGRMSVITKKPTRLASPSNSDDDSNEWEQLSEVEDNLEYMYQQYQERRSDADAKARAKRHRAEVEDDVWEGFESPRSNDEAEESDNFEEDSVNGLDEETAPSKLSSTLEDAKDNGSLSRKAAIFFDQDIFKGITGINNDLPNGHAQSKNVRHSVSSAKLEKSFVNGSRESSSDVDIEIRSAKHGKEDAWGNDSGSDDKPSRKSPAVDIITAEAMTLAQQIASGKRKKTDAVDDGFNRYSFREKDGLPEWFLDDESKHSKMNRPITAEGAAAIKEKLRVLNARPIKKVLEARARKKYRAAQNLEKLKKKSDTIAEDSGMSEKDKAQNISQMMRKASKKTQRPLKVVVAKGANRGISGRPRGVKGRYKMTDPRMKKDLRAAKRLSQKKRK